MHEKEHEQTHEPKGGSYSRNHLLIMALCCLIPIAILLAVVYANIERSYLPFILVLLCPLLMLLMHLPQMLPRKKENGRKSSTKLYEENSNACTFEPHSRGFCE